VSNDPHTTTTPGEFVWHPELGGKTFESVHRELVDQIQRDQRAYHLALDNAEKEEFGAFNSVRDLEKRWCEFDFGWFDTPPDVLADKILAFEKARESRQEMFSWQEWRSSGQSTTQVSSSVPDEKRDWRENLTDEQRKRIASAMSIGIILLMVLGCIVLYSIVR